MKASSDKAQASPTKQFFVSMLTRDISLADAILDLVDNCLDGALRLAKGKNVNSRSPPTTSRSKITVEASRAKWRRTTRSRWAVSRTTTATRTPRPSACMAWA